MKRFLYHARVKVAKNVRHPHSFWFCKPWVCLQTVDTLVSCKLKYHSYNYHVALVIYRRMNASSAFFQSANYATVKPVYIEEKLGLPERPRKPPSPYLMYVKQTYPEYANMRPKMSFRGKLSFYKQEAVQFIVHH